MINYTHCCIIFNESKTI